MRLGVAASVLLLLSSTASGRVCHIVSDCGADPTNRSLATGAIQQCIDACKIDGIVQVPPSSAFLISSLDFSGSSNLTIKFGANSTFHAVADPSLYPLVPFLPPVSSEMSFRPILWAENASDVTFLGPHKWAAFDPLSAATINGNGWDWWANYSKGLLQHQRPKLLEFSASSGLVLEDLVVKNSPMWTLHPFAVSGVRFSRLQTLAPRPVGNTDGHHLSVTRDAVIEDCLTDVGDDAFTATSFPWPNGTCSPTTGVLIKNTTMLSRNFAIGSQTFCGISNITMVGGRIGDDGGDAGGAGSSPWAVKIKQHPVLGGTVSDIVFDSVRFGRITPNSWQQKHGGMAITMYQTYAGSKPPNNTSPTNTTIRDITFRNITVTSALIPATLSALHEGTISRLTFDDFVILDTTHTKGWECSDLADTTLQGNVTPAPRPGTCGT